MAWSSWLRLKVAIACAASMACQDGQRQVADSSGSGPSAKPCTKARPASGLAMRGGVAAADEDYPFVGMIFYEDVQSAFRIPFGGRGATSFCSATLVCSDVVLTAAHCFDSEPHPEKYTFHAGAEPGVTPVTTEQAVLNTSLGARPLPGHIPGAPLPPNATRIPPPPRGVAVKIFNSRGEVGAKDLALLKLDQPLSIAPAALASVEIPEPDEKLKAQIVGYGSTGSDESGADVGGGKKKIGSMLFHGYMDTPENKALDRLGALYPRGGLDSAPEGNDNACPGDSGGATIIGGKLYGVISKIMDYKGGEINDKVTCSQANVTFFTVVPRQFEWINRSLGELCADGGPGGAAAKESAAASEGTGQADATVAAGGEGC